MKRIFQKGRRKKDKFFLVLDIGTEAVKSLIFTTSEEEKKENRKIIILGSSLQYFERYRVFDNRDFEAEVMKGTIAKAITEVKQNLSFSLAEKEVKKRAQNQKKYKVLVTLSSSILKARVVYQSFLRKRPEKKISKKEGTSICQQVFKKAQQEISQKFAQDFGILPADIQWLSLKVFETKIDGYLVSHLEGYEGKDLEFKILATFLPKHYSESITRMAKDLGLEILGIVHGAQSLPLVLGAGKRDGLFVDVGGEVSQIFLLKNGFLEQVGEFGLGGKIFSQKLSETLGIDTPTARILKERYSAKSLSLQSTQRIKEMFLPEKKTWFENLKLKIKEINPTKALPLDIFLFGGGSQLPEIGEVFTSPKVKLLYPQDLENIKDTTKSLKSPQIIPSLLIMQNICNYAKEIL